MKRFVALIVVCVLLTGMIAMTGCASKKENEITPETQTETDTESEKQSSPTAEVKTVSADGVEMDYIVFGTGEKSYIILPGLSIHSVMGSAEAIAGAYAAFAEEYTVYVFDRAKNIGSDYSVRDMADDTALAMKVLNIEKADIFGASQGGMIAMYLAIDYPELVNKMILGSTASRPNAASADILDKWTELAREKNETELLESFADMIYSEATLKAYRDTLISANMGITDEEYERFIIMANACKDFDCYDDLGKIQCPVFVIGSEGDRILTADASREIADVLECEIYIYDDSYGHGVYDEASDYVQRCLDFLEK